MTAMKMELLLDGSPDCPLLRLYDFDAQQACDLQLVVLGLTSGTLTEASLSDAMSVDAIDGCSLTLQCGDVDQGIVPSNGYDRPLVCRLSRSTWQAVAKLIAPFCLSSTPGHYQWLDETSPISWLLSPDGAW